MSPTEGALLPDDPTVKFLDLFADETAWDKVIRGVPIFVPHETRDREGKPYKVDAKRLQRIADRVNHLEIHYGVVQRLMPEHTKLVPGPDGKTRLAPQAEQPAVWGYARNARVGPWGPKQEPALLTDWYILPGKLADFKDRPYRSPEFFGPENEIRAIAVLKTEPRLDMGMLAYGDDGASLMQAYQHLGDWTFYSMPGAFDSGTQSMPDPTQAPDAAAPDDEFCAKCDKYMATKFPHLGKMHEAYGAAEAAKAAAPAPGLVPPQGPAAPATAPVAPAQPKPEATQQGHPEPQAGVIKDVKKEYAMDGIPEQYVKVFAAQNARVAALEKQLATTQYKAELAPLCESYGLDLAGELAFVQDYNRQQFEAYKGRLKAQFEAYAKRLENDVLTGPMIGTVPVGGNPNPGGKGAAADLIGTEKQLERAVHYQQEHPGCSGDDAWEYAISTAKTPRDFHRNGQAK